VHAAVLTKQAGEDRPLARKDDAALWEGVDRLVDRVERLDALRAHRLELVAARRWRSLGKGVPPEVVDQERQTAMLALAAPILLRKIREAWDGEIVLMKGLAVAALYPDPATRPFRDLDLLVEDAEDAHRALIAAGFEAVGYDEHYYVARHHLRPLRWPGLPLLVEVHRRPEWPNWSCSPDPGEIIATSLPASVGVAGVRVPDPARHALLVAAHSWCETPFRRLLDLVDALALAHQADRRQLEKLAASWEIEGVWRSTVAAGEAMLLGQPCPWSLRTWARDLRNVRDRTVLENHVRRLVAPFWALPLRPAIRVAANALVDEVRPAPGEPWSAKRARVRRALANAHVRLGEHHSFKRGGT
jgi:putative nucleotidyltransferase-like protein